MFHNIFNPLQDSKGLRIPSVNIIGDSSTGTVVTALNSARTAAGYTTTMIYTQTLIAAGYTGADLTTANYDVILVYMNG